MDKVKRLLEAGADLADAVRSALGGRSFSDVARDRRVNRANLTSALNGSRAPSASEIGALIAELGGTEPEWRAVFAKAAQRKLEKALT
jgi:hypothetical protein